MLNRLFSKRVRDLPSLPAGVRLYAIGDIHGRLDLFDDLLKRICADNRARCKARVELVLLGDLIDRGPESAGVVRRAMDKPDWADDLVVLMGNHEAVMAEAFAGDPEMARVWLRVGGEEALRSWGVDFDQLGNTPAKDVMEVARQIVPQRVRDWIGQLQTSYTAGDYHFVHAGVRPGVPLAKQRSKDAFWIRDEFLSSRMYHGAMVVHGHTISEDIEMFDNRIGLDTGAYATGRLTALCLEGSERWVIQTPSAAVFASAHVSSGLPVE